MAGDREKVLDKLKKLMAHAKSAKAIGSEAEAQSFAEMVQRMIAQHNISKAELTDEERATEDEANPVVDMPVPGNRVRVRNRRVAWLEQLATCVAQANFCDILVASKKSSQLWFVGRRAQAEMAIEVFAKLAEVAEQIADKEYVKEFYKWKDLGQVQRARGFRPSFLVGFAQRMRERYLQHMDELEQTAARKQGAMVLFRDERQQVKDYIKNMFAHRELAVTRLEKFPTHLQGVRPVHMLKFNRGGWRWFLLQGTTHLVSVHQTEADAREAKADLEKGRHQNAPKTKAENWAGVQAGQRAANAIDLGKTAEEPSLPPPGHHL